MSAAEYFALVRERTAAERTLPILNGKGPVSVLREPPWRCIRAGSLPHVLAALEAQSAALETTFTEAGACRVELAARYRQEAAAARA